MGKLLKHFAVLPSFMVCFQVYISRYLSPMHLDNENLSFDDQRILVNLLAELDFVKYQELKSALEKRRANAVTKAIML